MDSWFERNISIFLIIFLMLFVVESVNAVFFQLRQTGQIIFHFPQKITTNLSVEEVPHFVSL